MRHPSRAQELAAQTRFENDTKDHVMTILHDDGLYRHLLFKQPESSFYWYEIVTYPGAFTIDGDMGTWTFRRTPDMFEFFRGRRGQTGINPGYWGEKVQGGLESGNRACETYDGEVYAESVNARIEEHLSSGRLADWPDDVKAELRQTVKDEVLTDEYGNNPPRNETLAYELAQWFQFRTTRKSLASPAMARVLGSGMVAAEYVFEFHDAWEWDYKICSPHFLWVCWAIAHAVETYDAHKAAGEKGDPFTPADLGQKEPAV